MKKHATRSWAIAAALALAGLETTTFAQQASPKAKNDTIVMTGCVATAPEPGHFTLTNAVVAGTATTSPNMMPSSPAAPKKDGKDSTYKLMGQDLKAHLGHKVEVTGTMEDMKGMAGDKSPAGVASPASEMVNVKSVKMISATCPGEGN